MCACRGREGGEQEQASDRGETGEGLGAERVLCACGGGWGGGWREIGSWVGGREGTPLLVEGTPLLVYLLSGREKGRGSRGGRGGPEGEEGRK